MINSISLAPAKELATVARRFDADLVLTHCRGPMTAMTGFSEYASDGYKDVVREVADEWRRAADVALATGLPADKLWFDPGLGFAKNAAQSLELCVRLAELKAELGFLVLVGPSRKSYLTRAIADAGEQAASGPGPMALGVPPAGRLGATIAAVLDCAERGADMVRVHDVAEVAQALAYQRASRTFAHANLGPNGGRACSRD
jgi:dihydropteroate synthase